MLDISAGRLLRWYVSMSFIYVVLSWNKTGYFIIAPESETSINDTTSINVKVSETASGLLFRVISL